MYYNHIRHRFGKSSSRYDSYAIIQEHVAQQLASLLPNRFNSPLKHILEVGCGTGYLTGPLQEKYPMGNFLITDLSTEMVQICKDKHHRHASSSFDQFNPEQHHLMQSYDLITSSMSFQWFMHPLSTIDKLTSLLKPNGLLYYATIGSHCFKQWHDAARTLGLSIGTMTIPQWPGIVKEEVIPVSYHNALTFFKLLKRIGASQPRPDYTALTPSQLTQLCTYIDDHYQSTMDWHIIYGVVKNGR